MKPSSDSQPGRESIVELRGLDEVAMARLREKLGDHPASLVIDFAGAEDVQLLALSQILADAKRLGRPVHARHLNRHQAVVLKYLGLAIVE